MKQNPNFANLSAHFWANVKLLSQHIGYTERQKNDKPSSVKIPNEQDIIDAYTQLSLEKKTLYEATETNVSLIQILLSYFEYRANALNNFVSMKLMNKAEATKCFNDLLKSYYANNLNCPLPLNKQKREKSGYALLTCMVNILIAKKIGSLECNFDPHSLSYFIKDSYLVRTLSRRIDGAFPDVMNPIGIWEIKEYYHTTTFGSRIADGVYETLMDGMELKDLFDKESLKIDHLLIVDAYDTWWLQGKSYLCRMIDMLNMGLVSEILFGKEIFERIPVIVDNWINEFKKR